MAGLASQLALPSYQNNLATQQNFLPGSVQSQPQVNPSPTSSGSSAYTPPSWMQQTANGMYFGNPQNASYAYGNAGNNYNENAGGTTWYYYDPATGQTYSGPESAFGVSNANIGQAQVGPLSAASGIGTPQALNPISTSQLPGGSAAGSTGPQGLANELNSLYTPQYIYPNGVPQSTAAQMNNTATSNVNLSNPMYASSILNMLAPQFQQQDLSLQQSLADQGIIGGTTAGAMNQLGAQQQQTYMGDIQPYLLQQEGLALNQSQGNANSLNNAQQANMQAQNAMNQYNTGNLISNTQFNAAMQQQDANSLAQQLYNTWAQQGDWQYGLSTGSAAGQSGAFQPTFQQPSPVNFGALGSSFAPNPTYPGSTAPLNDASGYTNPDMSANTGDY